MSLCILICAEDIECLYDDKRMKPGLRTGAVENLNQIVGEDREFHPRANSEHG
jgi:hypothetical protein